MTRRQQIKEAADEVGEKDDDVSDYRLMIVSMIMSLPLMMIAIVLFDRYEITRIQIYAGATAVVAGIYFRSFTEVEVHDPVRIGWIVIPWWSVPLLLIIIPGYFIFNFTEMFALGLIYGFNYFYWYAVDKYLIYR